MKVIHEEVAKKLNLKVSDVDSVINSVMKSTKKHMAESNRPIILLNHFGSFRISRYKLDNYIRTLIKYSKRERNKLDKPYTNKLSHYWKLRKQLKTYKHVS